MSVATVDELFTWIVLAYAKAAECGHRAADTASEDERRDLLEQALACASAAEAYALSLLLAGNTAERPPQGPS